MAAGRAAGQPGEGKEAGEGRQTAWASWASSPHSLQPASQGTAWLRCQQAHLWAKLLSVLRDRHESCAEAACCHFSCGSKPKQLSPAMCPPSHCCEWLLQLKSSLLFVFCFFFFPSKVTWLTHTASPSRHWCQVQGLRPAQWGACQIPARVHVPYGNLFFKYDYFAFMFCSFLMKTTHAP